jgi:hypothetical protein
MGQLIPVLCEEMVPGDKFQIGNEIVIRFAPLIAPILHSINVFVHYFFVPYRLLWDGWEDFITGGEDGDDDSELPVIPVHLADPAVTRKYTLWDYFGFPIKKITDKESCPLWFPWLAYNFIFNEYYRDQNLQEEVRNGFQNGEDDVTNWQVLNRNWEKDYFTSCLPFQQRGVAPALPITGILSANFLGNVGDLASGPNPQQYPLGFVGMTGGPDNVLGFSRGAGNALKNWLSDNRVDLADGITFNVNDMRLVFRVQEWLERNARGGARYTEFLRSHFGVSPRDERLQRPEYIGGSKSPVIVSEVLQTSQTTQNDNGVNNGSPQGNLAGHGISANRTFCGSYYASEFGVVMGIMSVMPRTSYQDGIDRQWLRRTRYDFYFPEFANLGEQAVHRREVYTTTNGVNNARIFGYQGRYDEMRVKRSMVCGAMRDELDYWHLSRKLPSGTEFNSDFIQCKPADTKRIFAVRDRPGLIVNFGNLIRAIRPMPYMSQPRT